MNVLFPFTALKFVSGLILEQTYTEQGYHIMYGYLDGRVTVTCVLFLCSVHRVSSILRK